MRLLSAVIAISFLWLSPAEAQGPAPSCQAIFQPTALAPAKSDQRLLPYVYYKEILDLPRVPDKIRQSVLQSLAFVERTFSGMSKVIASNLTPFTERTHASRIIEIGSGSGYGLFHVSEDPAYSHLSFTLSDLYPDRTRWQTLVQKRKNLGMIETPVDMTDLKNTLPNTNNEPIILLNTISIHHLPDALVRRYFEEAEKIGAHIMIVEIDRTVKNLALTSAAVVPAMLAPFSRGLKIKERLNLLLWGWLVPVMPVIYVHDSAVSTLRQRTPSQWRELFKGLNFEVEYSYGEGPLKNFSVIKAFNRNAVH